MNTPAIPLGAKPRIAFLSTMHGAPWGGSEELWSRVALRLLQENRAEVFAHGNWHPGPVRQLDALTQAGATVEVNRPLRFRQMLLKQTLDRTFRTRAYLARVRPDLVIVSQGAHFDGAAWMTECQERGLRYAPIAHCFVDGYPLSDIETEALRRGYNGAVRSYFVSEANLRETRRQIGDPIPNARVVRNPMNVNLDAAPAWPEPADGIYRLASVARLEAVVKGQDLLFETLSAPKWKARPLHISLYGSGNNEQTLKRLQAMYGLDNVAFRGTTSNVESIWAAHHGLILTSRWEGLPLVVAEAMVCGRIAILTDVGGNAELLTDNDTGFIAAAPKPSLIDEALERAWQCRHEWQERGQRARQEVRQHIPQDAVGAFLDEILSLLK